MPWWGWLPLAWVAIQPGAVLVGRLLKRSAVAR